MPHVLLSLGHVVFLDTSVANFQYTCHKYGGVPFFFLQHFHFLIKNWLWWWITLYATLGRFLYFRVYILWWMSYLEPLQTFLLLHGGGMWMFMFSNGYFSILSLCQLHHCTQHLNWPFCGTLWNFRLNTKKKNVSCLLLACVKPCSLRTLPNFKLS